MVARGWQGMRGDWGVTANGYGVLLGVMKMFWNLIALIIAQSVNLRCYKLLNSTLKRVDFMIHK